LERELERNLEWKEEQDEECRAAQQHARMENTPNISILSWPLALGVAAN